MTNHPSRTFAVLLLAFVAGVLPEIACSGKPEAISLNGNASVSSQPARYDGYIDQADCETIRGWAWDENQPNAPVRIEVYSDDQLVAVIRADELRENLIGAGKGNGRHAYAYVIRPSLRDGQAHLFHLKIAGAGVELGNSPRTINCTFENVTKP